MQLVSQHFRGCLIRLWKIANMALMIPSAVGVIDMWGFITFSFEHGLCLAQMCRFASWLRMKDLCVLAVGAAVGFLERYYVQLTTEQI